MGTSEPYEALRQVLRLVDRMPVIGGLQRDMLSLKRTVYERRAPRLAAVGSVEAPATALLQALLGVSALANEEGAPLGGGAWVGVDAGGRRVQWIELDWGDDLVPDRFRAACDQMVPDVLLLLATPAEVEAGLEAPLGRVTRMLGRLTREETRPRVLPVVLPVEDPGAPAFVEHPEIEQRNDLLRQRYLAATRAAGLGDEGVHTVGDPSLERDALAPVPEGLEGLSERLNALVPEAALLETARALVHATEGRRHVAHEVIHSCAALGITMSLTPVPFADAAVLLPLQIVMVTTLAYLSGRAWDTRTAIEWLASMGAVGGAGMGLRWGARQLFKLVPGAGSVVAAGVAGAGTAAMGHSALAYFMRE